MKHFVWIAMAALAAASVIIAQAPAQPPVPGNATGKAPGKGGVKGNGKAAPAQSTASRPVPKTITPQSYPADMVTAGATVFGAQCGFCHGRDTAGGESGPDLTRSQLVTEDNRGDKIGPLVKAGRADLGMPAFTLTAADLNGIVAYIHDQKTKFEAVGGGRRDVSPSDLATGNVEAGKAYFEGAGGCAKCHSPTGDLQGVGTKYRGLTLLQRLLNPNRSDRSRITAVVTLTSGEKISGVVTRDDEFAVTVQPAGSEAKTFDKQTAKVVIDDPLLIHFQLLAKYTDRDMHNISAYLETLK
jgi:cytochrome c oxidase cbb3-type subunit 3